MTVVELSKSWRCWMCSDVNECALVVNPESGGVRLALCVSCYRKLGNTIIELMQSGAKHYRVADQCEEEPTEAVADAG